MGASLSLCKRRQVNGSLEDLGISEEYEWEGFSEERINEYLEKKEEYMEKLQEKQGVDSLSAGWIQQLPEEAQDELKRLLVRRAMSLVHVLRPIEEQRKGMRYLHSQGAISPEKWASYQQAEDECAAELALLSKESQQLSPESPPGALIRTAVQAYNQHGLDWPQAKKEEFAVHPDANEVATMQLQVLLKREPGESIGLSLLQEPPKEARQPGQESRLVIQKVIEDGIVDKMNKSQSEPAKSLQPGDRIVAVVDLSVPENDRKPVGGDADAMFQVITSGCTPLLFIAIRPLGPPLRFRVGQRVKAHYGDKGWQIGTVVKLWEQHPNGARSPYVVRLDVGQMVLAPRDSDECVSTLDEEEAAKDKEQQQAKQMPEVHPEAKEMMAMNLQFILKREPGELLGLKLNHEPPLESPARQQPDCQSRLVVTGFVPDKYVDRFNREQEEPAQRLQPGDRIVGILNAGVPEEEKKPVEGNSEAMLQVITKDNNSSTPLVFNVVRALGPPLRFRPGHRVKANVGDEWREGTIVKCWEQGKPYVIKLAGDQRVVIAPRDNDECVVKADPRFKVGDKIVANHGGRYKQGEIIQVGVGESAYEIKLEEEESLIYAPSDSDQCVRALARFKIGDKVRAHVASDLVNGVVEQVYHPQWVYAIRVDDRLVFAPEDTDAFVEAAESAE